MTCVKGFTYSSIQTHQKCLLSTSSLLIDITNITTCAKYYRSILTHVHGANRNYTTVSLKHGSTQLANLRELRAYKPFATNAHPACQFLARSTHNWKHSTDSLSLLLYLVNMCAYVDICVHAGRIKVLFSLSPCYTL